MFRELKIWLRLRLEEFNFRIREIVRRRIRKLVEIALTDLDLMAALRDIGSSVAFERAHLQDATDFKGRHQLYQHVLSQTGKGAMHFFLNLEYTREIRSIAWPI